MTITVNDPQEYRKLLRKASYECLEKYARKKLTETAFEAVARPLDDANSKVNALSLIHDACSNYYPVSAQVVDKAVSFGEKVAPYILEHAPDTLFYLGQKCSGDANLQESEAENLVSEYFRFVEFLRPLVRKASPDKMTRVLASYHRGLINCCGDLDVFIKYHLPPPKLN